LVDFALVAIVSSCQFTTVLELISRQLIPYSNLHDSGNDVMVLC
jgi:hypothetical protein